jgi:DNA anti-recombination protein RmuC
VFGTSSPRRQRVAAIVASFSIALAGAAWSGCGDDEEEEAVEAVNEALDQAEEQADEIGQQAEEAADEAGQQAEDAADEASQALEDAQDEAP